MLYRGMHHQLTEYLADVYETTKANLYPECLSHFFTELWKEITKCFRSVIQEMFDQNLTYPGDGAETLLQSISYLVKFMKTFENTGLELDFLTNQMEDNVFLLSLMTSPTHQLIILYLSMNDVEMRERAVGTWPNSNQPRPSSLSPDLLPCGTDYLVSMATSLHRYKKCFSGVQIVDWITTNRETVDGSTTVTTPSGLDGSSSFRGRRDVAVAAVVCQKLLECGILKVLPYGKIRKGSSYSNSTTDGADGEPTFKQAYPRVNVVSPLFVGRGFEESLEFDPRLPSTSCSSKNRVVEKQEFETTKEPKLAIDRTNVADIASPSLSSPSPNYSESVSSDSTLDLDVFQKRDDVLYRFTICTYEEEELNFLTESADSLTFLNDADQILAKIREHFPLNYSVDGRGGGSSSSLERTVAAGGSVQLEKCIMKGVTLNSVLELLCERACGGCQLSGRFLRTMDADAQVYAKDILEKLGRQWKRSKGRGGNDKRRKSLLSFLCPNLHQNDA